RIFPRAAFEAIGQDLLRILQGETETGKRPWLPFEQVLRDDVDALIWVRIPQLPSSRALGTFPIASVDEFMARVPADRSQWKIIPTQPRPFPAHLQDRATVRRKKLRMGALLLAGLGLVTGLVVGIGIRRRRVRT